MPRIAATVPPRPRPPILERHIGSLGAAGWRLATLLSVVLLLLGLSFGAITLQDHDAALEEGWVAAERAALGAAEHAGRSLAAARLVTDRVADLIRRDGAGRFRGEGSVELAAMLENAPQIGALYVIDETGRVAASSLDPSPPRTDVSDRPYFAPLRDGADSQLTALLRGRLFDRGFFSFNRAVRDGTGRFLGIVQAAMHSEEFARFQRGLGLGPQGGVGLFLAGDGAALMLHPLPAVEPDGTPLLDPLTPTAEVLEAAAAGETSGRFRSGDEESGGLLVVWQRGGRAGEVIATAALPRAQALAPFRVRVLRNAVLFGMAFGMLAGLGWAVAAALARSVASRRDAEADRRALSTVLEATADGVFALDAHWRFTFMNSRAEALLAPGRNVVGLMFQQVYAEGGPFEETFRRTMTARTPGVVEAHYPPRDRWLRAESHPREDGGIVVFFRDVTEVRAAAARLAESEARFRAMADNIPQLAWMARPDGWIFWYNRRWFDYTGTTLEQMEGWGWRAVHHPDHVEALVARLSVAWEQGDPWEETFPLRGRDGEYRWFLSRAEPVRDDAGRIALWFGTNTDITEQRAAEERVAESEARLRRVLDNLFVFVALLSPDGTLLETNRAPLEAAGLTLDEVQGRPFWDCPWWAHDPAVRAQVREACLRAAAGDASRHDVVARMRGDSRMIVDFQVAPLRDAEGRVTHLIPSATDVTARSAAEAALAGSEARLRLAQEAAGIGVFETDLSTAHAYWSPAMFEIYGLDPAGREAGVVRDDFLALFVPEDRAAVDDQRMAILADPAQKHFRFEFRIIRPDTGELRWVTSRGEVVRDETGRAVLLRGVAYDVTDRRHAEERQMLLAREVDHRAKNALAVVQAIVGLTQTADPARFRAAVTGRIAAMARAHTLLARQGWGSAMLRDLIAEEVAPHRADAAEGGDRVALAGPPVALAPDAAQPLAMALHELATNAVKYGALSTPGGRVEIGWEATTEGGLTLRWTERGGPPLESPPARRGFGSSVIRNTVERQLGGTAAFDWLAGGLACTLTLPAAQLRWPAPQPV